MGQWATEGGCPWDLAGGRDLRACRSQPWRHRGQRTHVAPCSGGPQEGLASTPPGPTMPTPIVSRTQVRLCGAGTRAPGRPEKQGVATCTCL